MKKDISYIHFLSKTGTILLALCFLLLSPGVSLAQGDGPRFYWKGLMGTNAVPLISSSMGGNTNPMDPSHAVIPGSNFNANMALVGYAKMLPIFKRSALLSVIVPTGRISSEVSILGQDFSKTARGYGDPTLMMDINVIGPKPIMTIPDMIRYTPGFSVDIITSLTVPIGQYDPSSPINIGQNRWYGRIGAPVVWQLGQWIPGKRTTLEFLPAVWIYGNNNNFVGKTLETSPMFQLEAHLTRDFTTGLWGSIDLISYNGGKATIDGVEGSSLNNLGLGGTLGYHINDNMQVMLSYSSTMHDNEPQDLQMDGFRMTLIYGWHKMIEGIKRMKSHE